LKVRLNAAEYFSCPSASFQKEKQESQGGNQALPTNRTHFQTQKAAAPGA
jgi:hypothetical protein